MTNYTLFHDAALRSCRVRWLLHELVGDAFTLRYVDTYAGEQYGADYLAINPNHAVPTLELTMACGRSMYMIESAAMIAFLADSYPEMKLAPPAGEHSIARADYLQILHFGASIDAMLWQIRLHDQILPESQADPRTIARYKSKFAGEIEPQLKARLERTAFICGNDFCAADCIIAHIVSWAKLYALCADPVFDRYLAKLSERSAYQRAFSDLHRFRPHVPPESAVVRMVTG